MIMYASISFSTILIIRLNTYNIFFTFKQKHMPTYIQLEEQKRMADYMYTAGLSNSWLFAFEVDFVIPVDLSEAYAFYEACVKPCGLVKTCDGCGCVYGFPFSPMKDNLSVLKLFKIGTCGGQRYMIICHMCRNILRHSNIPWYKR